VDDRRAKRRAALAGRAEAGEQRPLDGELEVGVGHHHQRVLAAELEARRLQVAAAQLADARAHRRGAREADLVDEPLLERPLQALEGGVPAGLDQVQHALRQATVDEQLGERLAERRRVLRRLPDHGVAAQDRGHQVPGRDRHREVARGDDRRDADRRAEGEQLLVGHLARHGLPVQAPALAQEEVAGVDDLLHLAQRLRVGLAHLARHEAREGLLVGLDQPADLLDRPAPGRRGRGGPVALGGSRRPAGLDEGGGVTEQHLGHRLVEACRVGGGEGAPGTVGLDLAADDRGHAVRRGAGDRLRHPAIVVFA
jgi:hypothetical protein